MEQNSNLKNKIEIYGIPEEVGRCPGCYTVTKLLKELNAPYTFYKVLTNNGNPVIFLNDKKQKNIAEFKKSLISLGYDSDIIED